MYDKISEWIDNVLKNNIPDSIVAFCFNLYDDGNRTWSMELVGTEQFDLENEDWACCEVTDFGTRQNPFIWAKCAEWDVILAEISDDLEKYLKVGNNAQILKKSSGVGVGFVDGNIKILYSK